MIMFLNEAKKMAKAKIPRPFKLYKWSEVDALAEPVCLGEFDSYSALRDKVRKGGWFAEQLMQKYMARTIEVRYC